MSNSSKHLPSIRTNHCQACKLEMPSILVRMAAASKPEKTLEMILPACQIPICHDRVSIEAQPQVARWREPTLSGLSSFVYHEDVINETAGTNGPSVRPTKKRHSMNDQGVVMAVMQIVTADQPSMHRGSKRRGLPLAMITFAGIWEMMYPT